MILRHLLASVFFFMVATVQTQAQSAHTPPAGSAERKAIMDGLRAQCEKDVGQTVIFNVQHLRVVNDWAFTRVIPVQPNGNAIDYSRTKYQTEIAEGAFDAEGEALLRRVGGRWKLVEWRFGASDTEVPEWLEKHHAPHALVD